MLPDITAGERRCMYIAMATTLAKLHDIDWRMLGLVDFGYQGNYLRRQVMYCTIITGHRASDIVQKNWQFCWTFKSHYVARNIHYVAIYVILL